ncbi:hypothetical protein IAT38_000950 [Cryptococcus sp. DSM 104549]
MRSEGLYEGFEAWVEGKEDGIRLNEYEYQIRQHERSGTRGPHATCYLETIDKPFRVKVQKTAPFANSRDWNVIFKLDGVEMKGCAWQPFNTQSDLMFSPVPTTDDANKISLTGEDMKAVGIIEITFSYGVVTPGYVGEIAPAVVKTGVANEKAKKFAYSVKSTNAKRVVGPQTTQCSNFQPSPDGRNWFTFVFNYRSRHVLVKTHVIDEPEPQAALALAPRPPARPAVPARRSGERGAVRVIDMDDVVAEEDVKPRVKSKMMLDLEVRF